jgi:hypothetical protein
MAVQALTVQMAVLTAAAEVVQVDAKMVVLAIV